MGCGLRIRSCAGRFSVLYSSHPNERTVHRPDENQQLRFGALHLPAQEPGVG